MGASNNGGVIFNQSKDEIIYTLHSNELTEMDPNRPNNSQKQDLKGKKSGTSNIYCHVKPGRISTTGLQDIDFGKYKFVSIMKADGGIVMNKLKLKDYESLRIKVRPDLSVKMMAENESKQLKQVSEGINVKQGVCTSCDSKADKRSYESEVVCRQCGHKNKQVWVCRFLPQRHCECNQCYQTGLKQKGMNKEN